MLWGQIRLLKHHHHSNGNLLERQGRHIQRLSCEFVDSTVVTAITQFCRTLRSLYLHLDLNSTLVQAYALEEMFQSIGIRLTKVHIRFDAAFVSPIVLWGLARLGRLTELFLDSYHSKVGEESHSREAYMRILHVCATLQSFTGGGSFLERRGRSSQLKSKNEIVIPSVKIELPFKGDRGPIGLFTALSRRLSSSSQAGLDPQAASLAKAATRSLLLTPSAPTFTGYSLHRLHIQSNPLDITGFYRLIGLCPLLEELTVRRVQGAFTRDTWRVLSDYCPRLRLIRLENGDMYLPHMLDLTKVVTDFSRLECLELVDYVFDKDPDLVALGTRLEELCQQHNGTPHPLRRLHITGAIDQSTQVLADALTSLGSSILLQSLTIGKTSCPIKKDEDGKPLVPAWGENPIDFSTISPHCLATLRVLDFTKVDFSEGALQLFPLIARYGIHLHSLGLSISQLYTLQSYRNHCRHNKVAYLDFSIPSLQTVLIGCAYSRRKFVSSFYEEFLRMLLDVAPGLSRVGVRPGVEWRGDVEEWRKRFLGVEIVILLPSQGGDFFE